MATRARLKSLDIDPKILDAIRIIIREEIEEVKNKVDIAITQLTQVNDKLDTLEKGIQDCSDRLDTVIDDFLPSISEKMCKIAAGLTTKILDNDVHKRKWSLIIQGVKGPAGEDSRSTKQACIKLARDHLGIQDADSTKTSACHRLSKDKDAGIILSFMDLDDRNQWLSGARNLKNHPDRISLSPDLPPIARRLKKELMDYRRNLPLDVKQKSKVQYLRTWPYVQLSIQGRNPYHPKISLDDITKAFLGFDPACRFDLN